MTSGQREKGPNMDGQQFDRFAQLVTTQTRRRALGLFAAAIAGATAPVLADTDVAAKKKRRKRKKKRGGGSGSPQDQCPAPGVCNADPPVCGSGADGKPCGCDRTTEGNNACIAFVESCESFAPCTSTQDCRDSVGFHFFCQANKTNGAGVPCGCGGRCLPECDNRN